MQQLSVPSQILDIDPMIDVVYSLGLSYHEQNGVGDWWSRKTAIRFVHLLIQDIVANNTIWMESRDVAYEFLKKSFELEDDSDQSDALLIHFDSVETYICERIMNCFCDNPWWVWKIHCHRDYVILESQGDYRVHIFHQQYGDKNNIDFQQLPGL